MPSAPGTPRRPATAGAPGMPRTASRTCTGPTPAQQCDDLIPWLIGQGAKRFAFPSANYLWPQLLNKYARKVVEANGGEVVFLD